MGLFGLKKEKVMPRVADVFLAEDLRKIKEVVGPKRGSYHIQYADMADWIMWPVEAPEKSYTEREWRSMIYAAGAMTKLEPDLAPALKAAIARFHAFRGKS